MDGMGLSTLYFWNKRRHYCFGGESLKNSPLPPKKKQKCKYWKLPGDQNLITQQVTNNPLYKGHLGRKWFGNSVLSWISPFRWERNPRLPAQRRPQESKEETSVPSSKPPTGPNSGLSCWILGAEKFWPALVCRAFGLFLLDPLFFWEKRFILI